jgi:hypothetical protein
VEPSRLDVIQAHQAHGCKTAPIAHQSHQKVTVEKQNLTGPPEKEPAAPGPAGGGGDHLARRAEQAMAAWKQTLGKRTLASIGEHRSKRGNREPTRE